MRGSAANLYRNLTQPGLGLGHGEQSHPVKHDSKMTSVTPLETSHRRDLCTSLPSEQNSKSDTSSPQLCAAKVKVSVVRTHPTLCGPVDCSPPGSSVHGNSPGRNTGVGCHVLLQGIFPTQSSNLGLPHCKQILYHLSHHRSPTSDAKTHQCNQVPVEIKFQVSQPHNRRKKKKKERICKKDMEPEQPS